MEGKANEAEYKIEQVVLFNPTLLPNEDLLKPQEEDFQDSKLIYFYP